MNSSNQRPDPGQIMTRWPRPVKDERRADHRLLLIVGVAFAATAVGLLTMQALKAPPTNFTAMAELTSGGANQPAPAVRSSTVQPEMLAAATPGMPQGDVSVRKPLPKNAPGLIEASSQGAPELSDVATRAATSMLAVQTRPIATPTAATSTRLREPIRVTDTDATESGLRRVTRDTLASFGHAPTDRDALLELLIVTLSEGQPDAYVDAALNAALIRGEYVVPAALQTVAGQIDTPVLLDSLLRRFAGQETSLNTNALRRDHYLKPEDSLAGLARQYYGEPQGYDRIANANRGLARGLNSADPGDKISIPSL